MTDFLPYVWRPAYRTGLEKSTGYDLRAAHEKARQYLATARTRNPRRPSTGTK
jgi:hypothetical protein